MWSKASKFLCMVAVVVMVGAMARPCVAQANDVYHLNYFSNAFIATGENEVYDQTVRIINTGQIGSPIDPATNFGTVCANIYVFDTNQEMISCCSCPITANGLLQLSVNNNLVSNTLTAVTPTSGVIKIVADLACNAFSIGQPVGSGLRAFGTHLPTAGFGTPAVTNIFTETEFQTAPLQDPEAGFLGNACSFVQYLGSGRGTCSCGLTEVVVGDL